MREYEREMSWYFSALTGYKNELNRYFKLHSAFLNDYTKDCLNMIDLHYKSTLTMLTTWPKIQTLLDKYFLIEKICRQKDT